ncbi:MAG: helix-turn-helix domain-containing protein [Smithellaceae bacterium]
MREWMTIKDLSDYLQIPESRIRFLIKQNRIPFYDEHGFLRFNRQEIDCWMKTPSPSHKMESEALESEKEAFMCIYRGKPIKDYKMTASRILLVESAWKSLPDFINKAVEETKNLKRDFLLRDEFKSFLPNFNDYLRISCQLGLIENVGKEEQDERIKHYYVSSYAQLIHAENDIEKIKRIVLDSILNIIKTHKETKPDEKHAIFLLWLFLKITCSGETPEEGHFRKTTDKKDSYYPSIRLGFAKSLCSFLLSGDKDEEREFLAVWESTIN